MIQHYFSPYIVLGAIGGIFSQRVYSSGNRAIKGSESFLMAIIWGVVWSWFAFIGAELGLTWLGASAAGAAGSMPTILILKDSEDHTKNLIAYMFLMMLVA